MNGLNKFSWSFGLGDRFRRINFERLMKDHLPQLYRLARGLADQPADAEDLVHDACVKAIAKFDKADFPDKASINAWLNRILVNTYRDQYRRTQRSPISSIKYHATSDDKNVVELVASTDLSPLESIHNRKSSSAINNAFSTLPPEVRVVSVLFLLNGFSYQEIADITDSPAGTVMSRLSRGRQQLRAQLSDYDPRPGHAALIDAKGSG